MKINQLFTKKVNSETLSKLMMCFNLTDLNDPHTFTKYDLETFGCVDKMEKIKHELKFFYLPCKAKVYLDSITVKKAITVLKQVLRLHGYTLQSKEKNVQSKKLIYYKLVHGKEKIRPLYIQNILNGNIIHFD
jgi:hypothetical protein